MYTGTVISIHIAPHAEARLTSVTEARAMPGPGLDGDRSFRHVRARFGNLGRRLSQHGLLRRQLNGAPSPTPVHPTIPLSAPRNSRRRTFCTNDTITVL